MARESTYRNLVAWQKAMDLVEQVYAASAEWPTDERFGLTSQVRRAAISIPANIAEGSGRTGSAELRRFLSIAHGSLCEVQTHLEIARRLGFISSTETARLIGEAEEVGFVIKGFIRSVRNDSPAAR